MCFVSVMLVPIIYYFVIPLWLTKSWISRVQFWAGLFMYVFCGPFLNIAVLLYASFYMDSFGWGKTRKVIPEDDSTSSSENGIQGLDDSDVSNKERNLRQSTVRPDDRSIRVHTTARLSRDRADEERMIGR